MEQPVVSATTSVLKYDMLSGKWAELGSQAGPCNITILKSPTNEYRFVGWKESNQEVVLNLFLYPSMNYTESTPTFHQWFDEAKNAYGLNFLDANEAKKFGIAVISAIEILNGPKLNKPGGDIPVPKKSVEKSPGYRTTNRKYSVDRQPPSNPTVSPYAMTGIRQTNDSSTAKAPIVMSGKPQASSGAPPPPGPPPAAPPPPGPPPSGPPPPGLAPAAPSLPSLKKPAVNDLASQLKSATLKPTSTNLNAENLSRGSPTPPAQTTQPASSKPPQMDFLSELKLKSQKRTDEVTQIKKTESPRTSLTPTANVLNKNLSSKLSSKLSSSNSDLTTTSFITSADLEKFRAELLQDIVSNMEKFKEDIINGIISRLN